MSEFIERELDWDDQIENDGMQYVTLPEGDYDFEVVDFERGRHPGSEKLPACNKATVLLKIVDTKGQTSTIKHLLFLHTKTESLLSAFFTAIGQKKKGEKVTMNWNAVVGSKGRAKVGIRKWTNDKGEERDSNYVKRFYESETQSKGFEPGRF